MLWAGEGHQSTIVRRSLEIQFLCSVNLLLSSGCLHDLFESLFTSEHKKSVQMSPRAPRLLKSTWCSVVGSSYYCLSQSLSDLGQWGGLSFILTLQALAALAVLSLSLGGSLQMTWLSTLWNLSLVQLCWDTGFLCKRLVLSQVLVPHAVVQSVCSLERGFKEQERQKKITKMSTL